MSSGKKYIVDDVMKELGWVFNETADPDDLSYKKILPDGQEAEFPLADWGVDSQKVLVETLRRLEDKLNGPE